MRKGIFALGLALAVASLGLQNVSAVDATETDSSSSTSTSTSSSTSTTTTTNTNTNTGTNATTTTNTKSDDATKSSTAKEASSSTLDSSKVTASDTSLKNAVMKTLEYSLANPDNTTNNGRILQKLVASLKQGATISASLSVDNVDEISSAVQKIIVDETAGTNLASIYDIKLTVTSSDAPTETYNLTELTSAVSIALPIPDLYKAALAEHKISVLRVHSDQDGTYETEFLGDVAIDGNGDVVFKTKKFSDFALTYDGEPITVTVGDDVAVPSTSAATVASTTVIAPDTAGFFGIELTVFHLLMLCGISLVVIALVAYAIKRAYLRSKISLK